MRGNKLLHAANLGPIKSLYQEKLGGEELRTSSTVVYLCLKMLYKQGYCSRSVRLPNHLSTQNLTCEPSLIMKDPNQRKPCLTFMRLTQKYEFHISNRPMKAV